MIENNKLFFKELINEGEKVLKRGHWDGKQYKNSSSAPSFEEYSSLIYRGMDIILKSFNEDSSYYRGLDSIVSDENKSVNPYYYAYCFGIIKGAYKAYLKFISERSSSPKEARKYMIGKIKLLEKASNHLHYEINKIFEMYDYFETHLKNYTQIRIEIFLLHSRNLFEFFYPNKTIHASTMCVFDFFDNYKEFENKKTTKKDLDFYEVKNRINKYLSHITYERCDSEFPKYYQIGEIMVSMVKTIKAFYEVLPDEYKNWDYIQRINNLVKNFENKHKTNNSLKKENIIGTTSSDSGVSISGFRKLS